MSSKKISEFPELEAIDVTNDDVMPIVNDATNKKISWENMKTALGSIVAWGSILGTLEDQIDLYNALNLKEDLANKATDLSSNDNTHYPTTAAVQTAINSAIAGLLDYRGTYDASSDTFPSSGGSGSAGAILKGDCWLISVSGILDGTAVSPGDLLISKIDTPGQTSGNWSAVENNIGYTPENVANKDTDGTLSANSDTKYASQKATKTYADAKVEDAINDGTTTIAPSQNAVYDALSAKAPLASPTFTGTVTTPVLNISGETASRIAIFDASKNVTSANTSTYPSLTELSYIKGLSSAVQTQLDGKQTTFGSQTQNYFFAAPSGSSGTPLFRAIVAADIPTLNQNTTGSAASLTTSRNIDGQAFNGTANITVIAPGTHAATSKTTPVDADELPLVDSAASNVLKKLSWANVKATLKTYFDGIYQAALGYTAENAANKDVTTGYAGLIFTTFTPTVTLGSGVGNITPVYSTNTGRYSKIGNRVFVEVYLNGDGGNEGSGTGQISIALPVTANSNNPSGQIICGTVINGAKTYVACGQIAGSATTIALMYFTTFDAPTNLTGTGQNNTTRSIRLSFCYEA